MENINSERYRATLDIISQATEMTLATIRSNGAPHASTVHFANDGIDMYAAISLDSQKAHEIRQDARVGVTVNLPYDDWSEIRGLSLEAHAELVGDSADMARASQLLLLKYPQFSDLIADIASLPWPGMLFAKISPVSVVLLDYTKGFGHTEYFDI